MTFGIEPERPRKTQCTVLESLYFLNFYEDASVDLLMVLGNLDLHLFFFSPPSFNEEKLLKQGTSVVVVRRAVVETSARGRFYSAFVWKFDFR